MKFNDFKFNIALMYIICAYYEFYKFLDWRKIPEFFRIKNEIGWKILIGIIGIFEREENIEIWNKFF